MALVVLEKDQKQSAEPFYAELEHPHIRDSVTTIQHSSLVMPTLAPARTKGSEDNQSNDGELDRTLADKKEVRPLVQPFYVNVPYRRFKVLQEWEGVVVKVENSIVTADLANLTNKKKPNEIVEFPIDEFSESDTPLVAAGAVFYWSIGYETSPAGQRWRKSEFRVRRSPWWSQSEIDEIKSRAQKLSEWWRGSPDANSSASFE